MTARWNLQPNPPIRCRCSHPRSDHGLDRKGRPMCFGSIVCGCREFRSPEIDAAMQRHPAGKANTDKDSQ